mmetsp:Transcript_40595/g.130609  ORF Transcript_40595/g.130609 Transcript_40595/m.130609 type:complete len:130 (+) Transcript_40595:148-537(+)|eukprot:CAMPEP_0203839708 /NCGR_PEP_ID=MMETSP0359-20131031/336_1 /ASSEMBLY_ACC=CAM_ASM_000338 /TAXON_ID=268821 /ORGANISM="Scrippsiella Hangoei, Strain SHTV-5" /LENGTH=129 /DNA_ID=CAMNT_0050753789 /DNA_START=62 /DNA_END=451 /DNA_ORIENTATION=-
MDLLARRVQYNSMEVSMATTAIETEDLPTRLGRAILLTLCCIIMEEAYRFSTRQPSEASQLGAARPALGGADTPRAPPLSGPLPPLPLAWRSKAPVLLWRLNVARADDVKPSLWTSLPPYKAEAVCQAV